MLSREARTPDSRSLEKFGSFPFCSKEFTIRQSAPSTPKMSIFVLDWGSGFLLQPGRKKKEPQKSNKKRRDALFIGFIFPLFTTNRFIPS